MECCRTHTHIVWHACCWEKERKEETEKFISASRMTRREHTVHHNVTGLLKSEVIWARNDLVVLEFFSLTWKWKN